MRRHVRTRDVQLEARVSHDRLLDRDRLLVGPPRVQRLLTRSHDIIAANTWLLSELPVLIVAVTTALITPLALAVAAVPRALRLAAWPAGVIASLGLVAVEPGVLATISVAPYAAVAVIAGLLGLRRLVAAPRSASRVALAVGLVFVPAATAWLLAYQAGYALLGYPPFWVLLTAAHFHVAGVALLIIVGRISHGRGRLGAAVALGCVLSVPLTAAGIYGPRSLEVGAALCMAASAGGAGYLLVTTRGNVWLRVAGALLVVTMVLAGAFALRDHGTAVALFGLDPLASMIIAHGVPNALLVVLVALLALVRTPPPDELSC